MYNFFIICKIEYEDMAKASLSTMEWTGDDIVEYILLLCAAETTFDDLIQCMNVLSPTLLKKYLFYLIDYDLISYNGQRQTYSIKDKGLEVLSRMIENKIV
jgi:predicted transcriptional regulator